MGYSNEDEDERESKPFESSVNLWGTQTAAVVTAYAFLFESSVNLWGTQTLIILPRFPLSFESSVNLWGTQTCSRPMI